MLILPKHSIDKKNTFLPVLPNAYAILKSDDFKNTIFKNAIFKIALIKIALPNDMFPFTSNVLCVLVIFRTEFPNTFVSLLVFYAGSH
jgi:hypothetical protein